MKSKYVLIPFLLLVMLILLMRIQQMVSDIGQTFISMNAMNIIFVLEILMSCIIIFMSFKLKDVYKYVKIKKNILLSVLVMICAILILYNAIKCFNQIVWVLNYNLISNCIMVLCSILAAVTFVMLSISFFDGRDRFKNRPTLILFPVIWYTFKLIILFIQNSSIACSYEEMLYFLSQSFIILFLFMQSECFENINGKNLIPKMFSFGFLAAAFSLTFNITLLCEKLYGVDDLVSGYSIFNLIDLFIAIYIITFLFSEMKSFDDGRHYLKHYIDDYDEHSMKINSKRVEDSMLRKNK